MQERFKRKDGGGSGDGSGGGGLGGRGRGFGAAGLVILLAIGVVGWLFTGIYQVNVNRSRRSSPASAHSSAMKARASASACPTQSSTTRSSAPAPRSRRRSAVITKQNLMLTGDENIIDIGFVITWRIYEPRDYLFNVVDVEDPTRDNHVLIDQIGESAMREIVGTSAFEPITTRDRTGVETRVKDLMQQTLNSYKAGIEIVSISIRNAAAPEAGRGRSARGVVRRTGQGQARGRSHRLPQQGRSGSQRAAPRR